jgi:hypothetical protein
MSLALVNSKGMGMLGRNSLSGYVLVNSIFLLFWDARLFKFYWLFIDAQHFGTEGSITMIENIFRVCVHRAACTYPQRLVVADGIQGMFPLRFSSLTCHMKQNKPIIILYRRQSSDSSHRETFESARSVVLGIFAAHAQKVRGA